MGIFKNHLDRMTVSKEEIATGRAKAIAAEANKLGEIRKKGFDRLTEQEKSWLFQNYPTAWDELMVNKYKGEKNE